jgi:hypothetical protein
MPRRGSGSGFSPLSPSRVTTARPTMGERFNMTNIDDDRRPQVQQLERMKNEFLVAQQRRRERAAASRRGDTGDGDGPPLAGPAADHLIGIAALRP